MEIEWAPSPNFRAGRQGRSILAIVNHITAGKMPGTLSWLQNPEAKASAHYLVTKDGVIYQLVKDQDTAWHAGIVNRPDWALYDRTNPNYYTIGIEHEALAGEGLTEAQYQATLWLHRLLAGKYNIAVNSDHIIGHYRIDSIDRKNDPGAKFPWARLFADLEGKGRAISIRVGNQSIQGIIKENQAWAPVRALVEALGHQLNWDEKAHAVLIPPVTVKVPTSPAGTVSIVSGNVIIQGEMVGDKVFGPVRQLVEILGHKVTWDEKKQMAIIE